MVQGHRARSRWKTTCASPCPSTVWFREPLIVAHIGTFCALAATVAKVPRKKLFPRWKSSMPLRDSSRRPCRALRPLPPVCLHSRVLVIKRLWCAPIESNLTLPKDFAAASLMANSSPNDAALKNLVLVGCSLPNFVLAAMSGLVVLPRDDAARRVIHVLERWSLTKNPGVVARQCLASLSRHTAVEFCEHRPRPNLHA